MSDLLCIGMGILDIIAGILIAIAFNMSLFSIIFGVLMIFKGGMSFL